MTPRKRKNKSEPPPPRSNGVAWVALAFSLAALALALSEKSWVQSRLHTINRNWGTMVGEIENAVARGDTSATEEPFTQAAEAARGGEDTTMAERLADAIGAVRSRAEDIGGDLSRRLRQVARDLERLRSTGEASEQTAASIEELRGRFRELEREAAGSDDASGPSDQSE